jgi:hypothetical protein
MANVLSSKLDKIDHPQSYSRTPDDVIKDQAISFNEKKSKPWTFGSGMLVK